jgi:hypothetical protein
VRYVNRDKPWQDGSHKTVLPLPDFKPKLHQSRTGQHKSTRKLLQPICMKLLRFQGKRRVTIVWKKC